MKNFAENYAVSLAERSRLALGKTSYSEVSQEDLEDFLENSNTKFFYSSDFNAIEMKKIYSFEDIEPDLEKLEDLEEENPKYRVELSWNEGLRFAVELDSNSQDFYLSNRESDYNNDSWKNHESELSVSEARDILEQKLISGYFFQGF